MAAAAEVVSEVVPKREAATGGGMLHSSGSVASHSSHTRSITACHTPTTRCGQGWTRWKTSHASLTSCTKQRRVGSLGGRLDVVWVSRDGCQGQNLPGLSWLLIRETSSSLGFCLQQLASLCFPERPFRCLNLPRLL